MPNSAFLFCRSQNGRGYASPNAGHLHGAFGVVPVRRVWRTFIEDHYDIGAEIVLNLHGFFRIEEDWIAVDRVTEVYALLGDLTDITRAEDRNRRNR